MIGHPRRGVRGPKYTTKRGKTPVLPLLDVVEGGKLQNIAIVTNPPAVTVLIDGNDAEITPLAFILIRHSDAPRTITISLKGYKTIEQKIIP